MKTTAYAFENFCQHWHNPVDLANVVNQLQCTVDHQSRQFKRTHFSLHEIASDSDSEKPKLEKAVQNKSAVINALAFPYEVMIATLGNSCPFIFVLFLVVSSLSWCSTRMHQTSRPKPLSLLFPSNNHSVFDHSFMVVKVFHVYLVLISAGCSCFSQFVFFCGLFTVFTSPINDPKIK